MGQKPVLCLQRPIGCLVSADAPAGGPEIDRFEPGGERQFIRRAVSVMQIKLPIRGSKSRVVLGLKRRTVKIVRSDGLERRSTTRQERFVVPGLDGVGTRSLLPYARRDDMVTRLILEL